MTVTETKSQGSTFEDFKAHCSGNRPHTELTLLQILKQRHPDYYAVQIDEDSLELQAYAAAGFATCEVDNEDETYTTLVGYEPSRFRVDRATNPGSLQHTTYWSKYMYTWNEELFLLYVATCPRGPCKDHYNFLLAPRGANVATKGLTSQAEKLLMAVGEWSNELHEEVYVFDQGWWNKSSSLWKDVQSSSWDDVVLDPVLKQALIEDVEGFFDSRDLYHEFQVPWKRGIIFHGLPGNGKTISIKALMSRLQKRDSDPVPSLYVKSLKDRRLGSQWAIRNIFRKARAMAPCLLIFEDLDSLIKGDTRSYFLNEVDGLENNDGILMVGSTNHLDQLDSAIRDRPSRFDRKYHYKLPVHDERTAYAQYWRSKLEKSPRLEFPQDACSVIAAMTEGFSFAYLKELFVATLLVIARGGKGYEKIPEPDALDELSAKEEGSDTVLVDNNGDNDTEQSNQEGEKKAKKDKKQEKKKEQAKKKEAERREKLTATRLRRQAVLDVEIPEALKDSVLVNVIQRQILVLLADMDNNEEPKSKKEPIAAEGGDSSDEFSSDEDD
jgi:transitional endoplasmic reticulum ATPase